MYPRKKRKLSNSEENYEQAPESPTEETTNDVVTDAKGYQGLGLLRTDTDGNHQSRSNFASTPLEYEIHSPIRGTAVIIDENRFLRKRLPKRKGSTEDAKSLHAIFQKMGFKSILTLTNVTHKEIKAKLKSVANEPESDIFLCVIMSHGTEGTIDAVDGSVQLSDLLDLVSEEKCPALAKKPKIFIIQACRGEEYDAGVKVQYEECCSQDDTQATREHEAIGDAEPSEPSRWKLSLDTHDMLVARSTVCNYVSFRHKEKGAWFIQELCRKLDSMHKTDHLLSILTQVNGIVATEYKSTEHKEMPMFSSTLSKLLYF